MKQAPHVEGLSMWKVIVCVYLCVLMLKSDGVMHITIYTNNTFLVLCINPHASWYEESQKILKNARLALAFYNFSNNFQNKTTTTTTQAKNGHHVATRNAVGNFKRSSCWQLI